jgi:F0F1-type ATP synthase alpha subunit
MKASNRDLLVLVKDEYMNERFMEQELEQLNDLLFHYETVDNFCVCHEIFDMNKYKILSKARDIQQVVRQKELKPFQFICNKN